MNRTPSEQGACDRARQYLGCCIGSELPPDADPQIRRHIESCAACGAELRAHAKLHQRLKAAVQAQAVPPELQVRIRAQIESRRSASWFGLGWPRWTAAVAASLLIAMGLWFGQSRQKLPALSDRPAQDAYIQKVSASLAAVMKVGLGDHIHCSIFRKYPPTPPPVEKLEGDLGPYYKGLLPVVSAAVPEGYRIIMAHRCGYAGRKFIHLTLEKDGDLLSLVIARKEPGESLASLSEKSQVSGIPIHQAAAGPYKVASFEAGNFLAYVVSDLRSKANLQVAMNLAPGVRDLLMKTPA